MNSHPIIFNLQVTRLRGGRPGFDSLHEQRLFLLSTAFIPALEPTQTSVQWVPGKESCLRGNEVFRNLMTGVKILRLTKHYAMKTYWGRRGIAPRITYPRG